MKRILMASAVLVLLSPGVAMAGHGKAGLWDVSTTANMELAMSPEVIAQMKKVGVTMPTTQTFSSQMCMTQAQVDSDKPPQMGKNDTGCDMHVTSQTSSAMTAEMVCNGRMKGAGHMQVAYAGAEHYIGSYAFKGSVENHPSNLSTTFKGDWVKADCGSVKPFVAK